MVDQFALALPHILLAIACWRLLSNDALDRDPDSKRAGGGEAGGA